jgi:DUF2075 family protein
MRKKNYNIRSIEDKKSIVIEYETGVNIQWLKKKHNISKS